MQAMMNRFDLDPDSLTRSHTQGCNQLQLQTDVLNSDMPCCFADKYQPFGLCMKQPILCPCGELLTERVDSELLSH